MCDECRDDVYIRVADTRDDDVVLEIAGDPRRKESRNHGDRAAQQRRRRQRGKRGTRRAAPKYATCHYCHAVASTWDHIVPRSKGGPNTSANLVPACRACNQLKADRMPTSKHRSNCLRCWIAYKRFRPEARTPPHYGADMTDEAPAELTTLPTPADDSITQRVRRELAAAVMVHHRNAEKLFHERELANDAGLEQTVEAKMAAMGAAMASNYGYTLAALLRLVYAQRGPEFGDAMAYLVDEMLTNGDFNSFNDDVMPAPPFGPRE